MIMVEARWSAIDYLEICAQAMIMCSQMSENSAYRMQFHSLIMGSCRINPLRCRVVMRFGGSLLDAVLGPVKTVAKELSARHNVTPSDRR